MAGTGDSNVLHRWTELIRQKCEANNKLNSIYKELEQLTTDKERFSFVTSITEVQNATKRLKTNIPKQEKSAAVSETLRSEGNLLFQKAQYKKALEKYNESVLTAPLRGKEDGGCQAYSLTLACRSAALFHLQYYPETLADISLTTRHGYPKKLLYKILDRKARCLYRMGDFFEAAKAFEESLEMLTQSDLKDVKLREWSVKLETATEQCMTMCNNTISHLPQMPENPDANVEETKQDCFQMYETSRSFRTLTKKCSVKWNASRGHHVIAEEDILPGDVILKEQPYACVLLPESNDSHCHHCLTPLLTVTPCDSCSFVRFCSDSCRGTSCATYHKHECLVLNAIISCGVGKCGLLALRIITKTPYKELFEDSDKGTSRMPSEETGFRDITSLVSHSNKRHGKDIWMRALHAVFITHILARSWFFSKISVVVGLPEEVVVSQIGSWILSLLQILPCNAHSVSELRLNPESVFESSSKDIAVGVYPTLSLLNHSCDPGVTRNFHASTVTSLATRFIPKGEEVCDNYGAVYAIQDRLQRLELLRPQYYFECKCEACEDDWPLCSDPSAFSPPGWRCEQCRSTLISNEQTCSDSKKTSKKLQAAEDYSNSELLDGSQNSKLDSQDTIRDQIFGCCSSDISREASTNKVQSKGSTYVEEKTQETNNDFTVHANQSTENPQLPKERNSKSIYSRPIRCPTCSKPQTIQSKLAALRASGGKYLRALDLLRVGEAEKALPSLMAHLRTVEETVVHPWRDLVMCQEAVKQCYSLMANCQMIGQ